VLIQQSNGQTGNRVRINKNNMDNKQNTYEITNRYINIKHFIVQLMHTNYKILRLLK